MEPIRIFPLSEGVYTIGHDKIFVPFDPATDVLTQRPTGSLLVEIQPFLVIAAGIPMLFDTGLGFKMAGGELQIHANIRKCGFEPGDIKKVFLSHLHKDHTGGISFINSIGVHELSFPNAIYYINSNEFEFGIQKGFPSYTVDDFEILKNSPQVEWLGSEGIIDPGISYERSEGHCPFHTTFLISQKNEKVFFGGDVAPQLKQLRTKYIAKYDFDGKKSMELRQHYAAKGKEEHWVFLFYHDVKSPVASL